MVVSGKMEMSDRHACLPCLKITSQMDELNELEKKVWNLAENTHRNENDCSECKQSNFINFTFSIFNLTSQIALPMPLIYAKYIKQINI